MDKSYALRSGFLGYHRLASPRDLVSQGGAAGATAAEGLAALVSRYDTVVACGLPLRQLAALDGLCRQQGKQLFSGAVRGPTSFVFVDLGPTHSYTVKVRLPELRVALG